MIWTYVVIGVVAVLVILLCLGLAIASFSFENYYENLKEANSQRNNYGFTTLEYVDEINKKHFNNTLSITQCQEYNDHYQGGVVAISEKTMYSNSLASLAIVSHELGHARQDKEGKKLYKHGRMRRIGKTLGFLFMPLVIAGVVLSLLNIFNVLTEQFYLIFGLSLIGLAFVIFLFAVFLKYEEIKIEKEASKYALQFLDDYLNTAEIKSCRNFLDSARLTYWASLLKTLLGWTFLTKKDSMFR